MIDKETFNMKDKNNYHCLNNNEPGIPHNIRPLNHDNHTLNNPLRMDNIMPMLRQILIEKYIHLLERDFKKSFEKLKKSTEELNKSNEKLKKSTEELNKSTEKLKKSTEELNKSTEELNKSTEELNKSTEALKKLNKEMKKTI